VLLVADDAPGMTLDALGLGHYGDLVDVATGRVWHGPTAVALVRPDGYLAALGTPDDLAQVHGYLRDLTAGAAALTDSAIEGAIR
jgi:hypothetical protein